MCVTSTLARLALGAACLLGGLCGCGTLYLHNDAVQQSTANARSALDKVDLAAIFDNQAAYLDDLQEREYAAIADSFGAQRDESLLQALQGVGGDKGDGRAVLGRYIDTYLRSLVCTSDRGNPARFSATISSVSAADRKTLADALAAQLKRDRAKMPPCVQNPGINPGGISLDDAIAAVQQSTRDLASKQEAADQGEREFKKGLEQATTDLDAGKATQKTFTDLLAKVHTDLGAIEEEANPYLTQKLLEDLSDAINPVIAATDPETLGSDPKGSRAKAALALLDAGFGVGDAFSKPPRVPHPNALAAAKAWLTYVEARADTQIKQIQDEQAALQARLAAVAQEVNYLSLAGSELDKPVVAHFVLTNSEGLEKLLSVKDDPTQRPDENAVATRRGAAADTRRGAAADTRRGAAADTRRGAAAALYYYSAAWSKGFIPARQLKEVSLPLAVRRTKLQLSRQASDAWLGTLKPAVATLAAYGEGGIDPKLVAQFLQVLGITAVAVGVN